MIKELYLYACPKLPAKQKRSADLLIILCVALFSSLVALFIDLIAGSVITGGYLLLSLLSCMDKDYKSRYMKLIFLCILNGSVTGIYIFSKMFPGHRIGLLSVIMGIVIFFIYEIVTYQKLKKRCFSSPTTDNKASGIVSAASIFIFVLIFRLFKKSFPSLTIIIMILISSIAVFGTLQILQKLVVYFITRKKVEELSVDDSK